MTSVGGARIRSGPPPDPNALKREHDKATWRHLPAIGREGETPAWPLTRPNARERTLWERIWKKPQAIVWEELGQFDEVAMYVRSLAVAERPKSTVAARTLIRQQADALGLTIPGIRVNRWIIDGEERPEEQHRPRARTERLGVKERLEVISGGGA